MEHAVVMGGSMAGLLAARVLSEYCQRVTLIEKEKFPAGAEQRRGVPQGRHTHGLLASGHEVLERYCPGLSDELVRAGAIPGDVVRDVRWFLEGACHVRGKSGLTGLMMSRPLLEARIRERVAALENVTCRDNTAVEALEVQPDTRRVIGIRVRSELVPADLVVDATGRGSKMPQWLEQMGFDRPVEERVDVRLAYTTRLFRRRATDLKGDHGTVIAPTPDGKRGGVMLAQEDDRWTVTLIAHFQTAAPEELNGFIEYSRTLPAPYIYDVIRNAEPIGDGHSSRFPASVRRHYERMRRFPEGLLVFGDAISSFNPIYGQGMSVACLQAIALDEVMRVGPADLARRFFARAASVVDIPWSIAVGNDLRMPETVGPRTATGKLINWYMTKLHKAAHSDLSCAVAFHRVSNLLAPPPSVMNPRVALRVLAQNIAGRRTEKSEQLRALGVGR
jgi:2-polyprenyl-6-methoxyphenol hydroxylase-like FAD-dependent oxidoreductase